MWAQKEKGCEIGLFIVLKRKEIQSNFDFSEEQRNKLAKSSSLT